VDHYSKEERENGFHYSEIRGVSALRVQQIWKEYKETGQVLSVDKNLGLSKNRCNMLGAP